MSSQVSLGKETEKKAPGHTSRGPTALAHLPSLTVQQQYVLDIYCRGQMEEWLFQQHLANDPILADYVRLVCRSPRE
ncbi:hypothetical protein ATY81_15890 [Rhizobium sp. R72]|nr:hypothetical protein ATY81_15890 [Rhizobium sp. R72]OWV92865.1 hypothetical protein ATY80_15890 [Rhizobium sp. R711]